jgi:pyridoxal phosphate enzyme (YggS family)
MPPPLMPADRQYLLENVLSVRRRIANAAIRSGRTPDAITLVAVTKYVDSSMARALVETGCVDLGESRPQELWQKSAELADLEVRWHAIGHLQRNKIARTLAPLRLLHSGDSLRLLEAVDLEAAKLARRVPVLIEVNVSGDAEKHGFGANEIEPLVPRLTELVHLDVRGLMTMAGREATDAETREQFARLRTLGERLSRVSPASLSWKELSMGMSGDFELAIEEGATIVRVGSALFEGLA